MDIEILSKIDNNVVNRIEYCFLISFESKTPSRGEIREKIKEKVGANPSLLVVYKVEPLSGRRSVKVNANVYKDEETLRRVEPLYILKRNGLLKEEQKEEKPSS